MERFKLDAAQPEYDASDPEGYRAGMDRFGPKIGATQLGGSVYELPPGQSICPYHYEYPEEEWLFVLSGRVDVRTPEGEEELGPMEVVCFPFGPEGAHKVTNRGEETARVVMLSTKAQVGRCGLSRQRQDARQHRQPRGPADGEEGERGGLLRRGGVGSA